MFTLQMPHQVIAPRIRLESRTPPAEMSFRGHTAFRCPFRVVGRNVLVHICDMGVALAAKGAALGFGELAAFVAVGKTLLVGSK